MVLRQLWFHEEVKCLGTLEELSTLSKVKVRNGSLVLSGRALPSPLPATYSLSSLLSLCSELEPGMAGGGGAEGVVPGGGEPNSSVAGFPLDLDAGE